MNFSPRMEARISGFSVIGALQWRLWNGVVADVWEVACEADAGGYYISPDPRLFVVLDMEGPGGSFEIQSPDRTDSGVHRSPWSMSYLPANFAITSHARGLSRLRHLDLHFSENAFRQRFGKAFDYQQLVRERLQFEDGRIAALAGQIAAECANAQPLHDLYGEGLVNSLLALLFDVRPERTRRRAALSRRQLADVTEFIEAHCFETIRLADLAALVDLSQTHFSHAFKASTGMPPHRWQMHSRIRQVQQKFGSRETSLTDVANISGFADQAHFTRVFKSVVGLTPAEWRRQSLP